MTNRLQGRLLRDWGFLGFRRSEPCSRGFGEMWRIACRAGSYGIGVPPVFVGASLAREVLVGRDGSPEGQAPTGFGGIPGSGFVDACAERVDDGQVFDGLTALEVFGDQVSAT